MLLNFAPVAYRCDAVRTACCYNYNQQLNDNYVKLDYDTPELRWYVWKSYYLIHKFFFKLDKFDPFVIELLNAIICLIINIACTYCEIKISTQSSTYNGLVRHLQGEIKNKTIKLVEKK